MAIPKICGIEQEYAIVVRNASVFDPIHASYLVINSFDRAAGTIWDYDRETPFLDARGFSFDEAVMQISRGDNYRINNLLLNGARFYVDHAHPEFSTAECLSVLDLIAFDRAGERILDVARQNASLELTDGEEILIYKNNSDHKGNSYGCHENYLVSTELFQRLFPDTTTRSIETYGQLIPFLVTRQIMTGAGKVGSENGNKLVDFQISQRSDFFEITIGANTTANRPIINTRDEPHADKKRFRRLHVIVGDSNMCEVSSLLKIGTTRLVLSMMEDGALELDFILRDPVDDIRRVSHDTTLKTPVTLQNGRHILPLEIQNEFLQVAKRYCDSPENNTEENRLVLHHWERILKALEDDPLTLDGTLDWVTKYILLQRHIERKKLSWDHPRVRRMDIVYHDVCRDRGLYYLLEGKGKVERLLDGEERIKYFVNNPPVDTRAYFRSQCLRSYGDDIVEANWDIMHFRTSGNRLKKVPLLDPTRGTQILVDDILKQSDSIEKLLNTISA
jgi:proteasome accessory factor A